MCIVGERNDSRLTFKCKFLCRVSFKNSRLTGAVVRFIFWGGLPCTPQARLPPLQQCQSKIQLPIYLEWGEGHHLVLRLRQQNVFVWPCVNELSHAGDMGHILPRHLKLCDPTLNSCGFPEESWELQFVEGAESGQETPLFPLQRSAKISNVKKG